MSFFTEVNQQLDDFVKKLDSSSIIPATKKQASDLADEVIANAEAMGGSIAGDIDNALLDKAKLIKQKLNEK